MHQCSRHGSENSAEWLAELSDWDTILGDGNIEIVASLRAILLELADNESVANFSIGSYLPYPDGGVPVRVWACSSDGEEAYKLAQKAVAEQYRAPIWCQHKQEISRNWRSAQCYQYIVD